MEYLNQRTGCGGNEEITFSDWPEWHFRERIGLRWVACAVKPEPLSAIAFVGGRQKALTKHQKSFSETSQTSLICTS